VVEIPFEEHHIDLDTGRLFYLKGGEGRPLLHLHPAGGRRVTPPIAALARRHAIYMPTTPGFDGTPEHAAVTSMPDLADLAAKLVRGVIGGSCDVMAESFGGWTALWLAVRHPDLVEQLVLEAPAGLRTTGGLPADPAQRLRMLFAVPERAPKETRAAEVLAQNRRLYDLYRRHHARWPWAGAAAPKARTLLVFGTLDECAPSRPRGASGQHRAIAPHLHRRRRSRAGDQPGGWCGWSAPSWSRRGLPGPPHRCGVNRSEVTCQAELIPRIQQSRGQALSPPSSRRRLQAKRASGTRPGPRHLLACSRSVLSHARPGTTRSRVRTRLEVHGSRLKCMGPGLVPLVPFGHSRRRDDEFRSQRFAQTAV
jgi:pimeloyl-ACP methyl ester carboxylesterase